jgi:asparagine synthase (glutamine-hydrolysing)
VTGQRVHRLASLLRAHSSLKMYETLMCRHDETWVVGAGATAIGSPFQDPSCWLGQLNDAEAMMLFDVLNVLPDDFLVKVDRAAMGASLETRAPLLDPEIFELVWRMPVEWKVDASRGKILARELLSDFVPSRLVERPKQGFGIPISPWLRGPLREWAEDLLDQGRLRREGFLQPEPIRERWKRHLEGTHDCLSEVWSALVFQQWYADQRRPQSSRDLRAA